MAVSLGLVCAIAGVMLMSVTPLAGLLIIIGLIVTVANLGKRK